MSLAETDPVAIYAAIVATLAFFWQVWSYFRAKRPQVSLLLDTWQYSPRVGNRQLLDVATIRVINDGGYAIIVDRLYFLPPAIFFLLFFVYFLLPKRRAEIQGGAVKELPFKVPARDAVSLTVRPSQPYVLPYRLNKMGPPHGTVPRLGLVLRTGQRYPSRRELRAEY